MNAQRVARIEAGSETSDQVAAAPISSKLSRYALFVLAVVAGLAGAACLVLGLVDAGGRVVLFMAAAICFHKATCILVYFDAGPKPNVMKALLDTPGRRLVDLVTELRRAGR